MSDAATAIASFERTHQLRVVVHDLAAGWALPPERGIHSFPRCQVVKNSVHGWRCYDFEISDLREKWQHWVNGRIHCCHAGVIEIALPLVEEGRLVAMLFVGQMSGDHACCDISASASGAETWWSPPPERRLIDRDEAEHLLEQARQLGARLMDLRPPTETTSIGPPRERRIETFLASHYARTDLSIAELAEHLQLSESRTSHFIKASFGQTFVHLLTSLRLRRAKELLTHTDLPISRIADQVGFNDLSHFHRVFKRWLQVSPRRYRTLHKSSH